MGCANLQLQQQAQLILHQLPLPRKSLKRGKDILVSTSWWEVANHRRYGIRFTVRILGGITHYLSVIPLTLERSKDRLSLVYPPDLARLTPSDRYPELDNNNFRPVQGLSTQTPQIPRQVPPKGWYFVFAD